MTEFRAPGAKNFGFRATGKMDGMVKLAAHNPRAAKDKRRSPRV